MLRYNRLFKYKSINFVFDMEFIDRIENYSKRLILWSAQLFAAVSIIDAIQLLDLFTFINELLYNRFISGARYVLLFLFALGWSLKFLTKIFDKLSGGGWIPESTKISHSDINKYFWLYEEVFAGHDLTPAPTISKLIEEGGTYLYIVSKHKRLGNRETVPCGFYVVQFLSNQGLSRIHSGDVDGRSFDSTDLSGDLFKASGIYIGAMGGLNRLDKGFVMYELLQTAKSFPNLPIFSRPATPEGVKIAKKYGLQPLRDPSGKAREIWHDPTIE